MPRKRQALALALLAAVPGINLNEFALIVRNAIPFNFNSRQHHVCSYFPFLHGTCIFLFGCS
jgi:hypothetical protein